MTELVAKREFMCMQYVRPGRQARNIGVLVLDENQENLLMQFAEDLSSFDKTDMEILADLTEELHAKAGELGAAALIAHLRATISRHFLITEVQPETGEDIHAELDGLAKKLIPVQTVPV